MSTASSFIYFLIGYTLHINHTSATFLCAFYDLWLPSCLLNHAFRFGFYCLFPFRYKSMESDASMSILDIGLLTGFTVNTNDLDLVSFISPTLTHSPVHIYVDVWRMCLCTAGQRPRSRHLQVRDEHIPVRQRLTHHLPGQGNTSMLHIFLPCFAPLSANFHPSCRFLTNYQKRSRLGSTRRSKSVFRSPPPSPSTSIMTVSFGMKASHIRVCLLRV